MTHVLAGEKGFEPSTTRAGLQSARAISTFPTTYHRTERASFNAFGSPRANPSIKIGLSVSLPHVSGITLIV